MAASAIRWSETWHLAIEALRANRVRAALTMLGVVIGSACIVLVVTVGLTGRTFVRHQIEAVGSNIVFASLAQPSASQTIALGDQISMADLDAVREEIPQAVHVAGTNDIPSSIVAGGQTWPVVLIGVTPEFQQIRNLIIPRGRYFDDGDFSSVSKVCVVSEHLAEIALPGQDPIGQSIRVGELTFTVIGVFRERIDTFGQSEIRADSLLVPFPLVRYYTGDAFLVTLYAQANRPENVPLLTDRVAQVLKSRHRPESEYNVQNLSSILGYFAPDFLRADDCSAAGCHARAGDQRHRHHEHHARHRDGAHARDRASQSHRRAAAGNSLSVSVRSDTDQRSRRGDRNHPGCGDSVLRVCSREVRAAARGAFDSRLVAIRDFGFCSILRNRRALRIPAGENGRSASACGISAL